MIRKILNEGSFVLLLLFAIGLFVPYWLEPKLDAAGHIVWYVKWIDLCVGSDPQKSVLIWGGIGVLIVVFRFVMKFDNRTSMQTRDPMEKAEERGRKMIASLRPADVALAVQSIQDSPDVLEALGRDEDDEEIDWSLIAWWLSGNVALNGMSPLEVLDAGGKDAVLRVARTYGEQGAA